MKLLFAKLFKKFIQMMINMCERKLLDRKMKQPQAIGKAFFIGNKILEETLDRDENEIDCFASESLLLLPAVFGKKKL